MKLRTAENKNGIIIGMILGDGYLDDFGALHIRHSINQKDYVLFKQELLSHFFTTKYFEKDNPRYDKMFYLSCIRTKTTPYLKNVKSYMYTPKKKVNRKILNKLTPLGLAIWWMDDGSLVFQRNSDSNIESRKGYLNTQGYSLEENEIILNYFKEVLNVQVKIHKDRNLYRLYFNSSELKKFLNIIGKHIIPSMQYKRCMRYGKNKKNENLCKKECCFEENYCLLNK